MSPCRWDYIFTDMIAGVWRVVSEDSDHIGARFALIHRLREFDDCQQPTYREMCLRLDQSHALYEVREVVLLRSSEGVRLKERDNHLKEVRPPRHAESVQMFFVIVESTV
jgi:uncharacterized protein (UPF0179 family)